MFILPRRLYRVALFSGKSMWGNSSQKCVLSTLLLLYLWNVCSSTQDNNNDLNQQLAYRRLKGLWILWFIYNHRCIRAFKTLYSILYILAFRLGKPSSHKILSCMKSEHKCLLNLQTGFMTVLTSYTNYHL